MGTDGGDHLVGANFLAVGSRGEPGHHDLGRPGAGTTGSGWWTVSRGLAHKKVTPGGPGRPRAVHAVLPDLTWAPDLTLRSAPWPASSPAVSVSIDPRKATGPRLRLEDLSGRPGGLPGCVCSWRRWSGLPPGAAHRAARPVPRTAGGTAHRQVEPRRTRRCVPPSSSAARTCAPRTRPGAPAPWDQALREAAERYGGAAAGASPTRRALELRGDRRLGRPGWLTGAWAAAGHPTGGTGWAC